MMLLLSSRWLAFPPFPSIWLNFIRHIRHQSQTAKSAKNVLSVQLQLELSFFVWSRSRIRIVGPALATTVLKVKRTYWTCKISFWFLWLIISKTELKNWIVYFKKFIKNLDHKSVCYLLKNPGAEAGGDPKRFSSTTLPDIESQTGLAGSPRFSPKACDNFPTSLLVKKGILRTQCTVDPLGKIVLGSI